ncbi:MAG: hypothetical protein HKN23_14985 [Verrucomicrobiales bacterium]|nr:hypothetical protein [Verrucomicrobiales bacterium]
MKKAVSSILRNAQNKRGGALIMTILIISMMTILITAYLASMQIEQKASHAFANTQRAKMIAQGTVSHAIDLLRSNIPEPSGIDENAATAPGENWSTNPGRLTVFDASGNVRHIALHSGEVTRPPSSTLDPNVHSVDLNEPLPGDDEPMIAMALHDDGSPDYSAGPPEMRVNWVPILKKPGQSASKDNPIVGRYAFWMDDETAKINYNVALGKPQPNDDPQQFYHQYDMGMVTPLFRRGAGDVEFNQGSRDREWALGKLRSVNLDVLFQNPTDLNHNQLLAHAWLRGFSRYPEAIVDFVEEPDPWKWYAGNKFNLTFYSRGPEFNAFGRPRLVTTNIPLSLEAGPLYQLPYVYNDPATSELDGLEGGTLHLHSLMGSLGFTHVINDEDLGRVHAANIINRAQLDLLMRYFHRKWPGYGNASFVDKYGELECYQIALNMLAMARNATTVMSGNINRGSRDWAWRTTSVNYSPHGRERPRANPERYYWQIEPRSEPGTKVPMTPQTPGPHIMEVRLKFRPVQAGAPGRYRIQYRYETEYYMHGFGPVLQLWRFPTKVDYFHVTARGAGKNVEQKFGPTTAEEGLTRADRDWNFRRTLGRLRATAGRRVRIGPLGGLQNSRNRILVSSPPRAIGNGRNWAHGPNGGTVFNAAQGRRVKIDLKWRLGMGVNPGWPRPRQMIPIGEREEDTLDASFELDLRAGDEYTISWQIIDPRLSWNKLSWTKEEAEGGDVGTPGVENEAEPLEFSSEKSKFRYIQRGPGTMTDPREDPGKGKRYRINRPDEYNSRSRVSSKGYWSFIHTGIQNLAPYRTIDLGGGNSNPNDNGATPPDYLLLDLLGATYPMQHDQWRINSTLPDEFSTVSFMHSTAGQINLNSKIYPQNNYFQAPVRKKPLEAVFKYLRSDSEVRRLVDGVTRYQEDDYFRYIGEIAKVENFLRADSNATQWQNEDIIRNMAGCLTTKSNCFGLWGVSQVVQKSREHTDWGNFEDRDRVLAEKRFFAVIERYIWPGKDGIPGNGHFNSTGIWDKIAVQRQQIPRDGTTTDTLYHLPGSPPMRKVGRSLRLRLDLAGTYPVYDGPQPVTMGRYTRRALGNVAWEQSTLEHAYNPPQAVIKYKVVYFKYLDE